MNVTSESFSTAIAAISLVEYMEQVPLYEKLKASQKRSSVQVELQLP